ncbi:MucB/RseB-like sigma(E) regulatory protein [Sinobacterium caligoides]|uniref:MucB/RseB-like sigma(E) regulatory protein n=1 Tax=Sinobacterium caligoides TaxID=933926 RepID=A0A3N2DY11_9GAMM|nr:MucB/RseB C-terminal domain-containing protein [Sinobacterium caligoides]ROS04721.1 MucB/RseB-like sigma(E) regulatory protein [Sinobacterium caligoides]
MALNRGRWAGLLLLSVALLPVTASAEAAVSPRERLSHMVEALRNLDYSGEFTFERGGQLQALRVAHRVENGVEKERILFLNGEHREIIRDGHKLSCIHPGQKLVSLQQPIDAGKFFAGEQVADYDIQSYYRVVVSGRARIADRDVVKITVEPRDAYRNGYQFYLDKEHNIPLKSVLFSSDGQILERFQFVSISFDRVTPKMVAPSENSFVQAHHHTPEGTQALASNVSMQPQWLPVGFKVAARSVDRIAGYGAEVTTYTDGLATLSLVVEPISSSVKVPQDLEGKARFGGTVALTRTYFIGQQAFLISVVGEVPVITAAKVARSVVLQYKKPQQAADKQPAKKSVTQ